MTRKEALVWIVLHVKFVPEEEAKIFDGKPNDHLDKWIMRVQAASKDKAWPYPGPRRGYPRVRLACENRQPLGESHMRIAKLSGELRAKGELAGFNTLGPGVRVVDPFKGGTPGAYNP